MMDGDMSVGFAGEGVSNSPKLIPFTLVRSVD